MDRIYILDPATSTVFEEQVTGGFWVYWLYKKCPRSLKKLLRYFLVSNPIASSLIGFYMRSFLSRSLIKKTISRYANHPDRIDLNSFEKACYPSFNAFFIRKLKAPQALTETKSPLIAPATGRYLLFPKIEDSTQFFIKSTLFDLTKLVQDSQTYDLFKEGSMALIRLAPQDYHRFHFPISGSVIQKPRLINGFLDSVNPWALSQNINYLTQNKRVITLLDTSLGKVGIIEIGAFAVGSIEQTFHDTKVTIGQEKGFFQFGGSSIALLFEKEAVRFSPSLLNAQLSHHLELYLKVGTSLV